MSLAKCERLRKSAGCCASRCDGNSVDEAGMPCVIILCVLLFEYGLLIQKFTIASAQRASFNVCEKIDTWPCSFTFTLLDWLWFIKSLFTWRVIEKIHGSCPARELTFMSDGACSHRH